MGQTENSLDRNGDSRKAGVGRAHTVNQQMLNEGTLFLAANQNAIDVYFGGRLIWQNGKAVLRDRLGSVMARAGDSTALERHDYFPYGEERTPSIGDRNKFGTYHRDQTGLDYADQRYYNSAIGRFLSADPYEASGGATEPASWGRGVYVHGDPVRFIDPRGLTVCDANGNNCYDSVDVPGSSGTGGGSGGNTPDGQQMEQVNDHMPGAGGSQDSGGPLPPTNEDRLKDSLKRIGQLLKNRDNCARAIGAPSPNDAMDRISRVKIAFKDLGGFKGTSDSNQMLTHIDAKSGPMAQWNPILGFRGIYLNTNVDWANPDGTIAVDQNGSGVSYRLATGNALQLGVASVSAQQFMDLTILHELAHAFKVNHPNGDHTAFEKRIWEHCFN
jgi:RHS repeat-associated protein